MPVGRTEKKYDDIFGHRDTKTQRTTRCRERARRGAAQRRARRANRKRTTTGPWLGRSFAVGAPHGSACGAGRPRRAPLCLSVSVACPNQYVAVITKCCTEDFAQAGNREVSQDRRRPHQKSRRIPIPRFASISCLRRLSALARPEPVEGRAGWHRRCHFAERRPLACRNFLVSG